MGPVGQEAGDPAEEKKLVPTIVLECKSLCGRSKNIL